jgi:hypothetical protein
LSPRSHVVRLTQLQDRGVYRDEDSALAKMATSLHMRETVALAREIVGGNRPERLHPITPSASPFPDQEHHHESFAPFPYRREWPTRPAAQ